MILFKLNYIAIFICALIYMGVGALWYSPLMFGKTWMQANRFGEEDLQNKGMFPDLGFAFVAALVLSVGLAILIRMAGMDGWFSGAIMGLFAGILISAPAALPVYVFENRPLKLYVINEGMPVFALLVMGAVIGGWK